MTVAESAAGVLAAPAFAPSLSEPNQDTFGRSLRWCREASMLVGIVVMATAMRLPRLGAGYWGDEAITVGIASRPLTAIPEALRLDGSPPLYYFLLHAWMGVFGSTEVATHSLSVVIAAACIPIGWWCGRLWWGAQAGWAAAVLVAVSSYLSAYGAETRMYALLALGALGAVGGWSVALRGRGRFSMAVAVSGALVVVYTHDWGLYLVVAMVLVGLVAGWRDRACRRRTLVLAGAVTVGYLPWAPSFWHQLSYTGAPWSPRPGWRELLLTPWQASAAWAWPVLLMAVILAAGWAVWRGRGRWGRPHGAASMAAWVCGGTVVAGWVGSQLVRSWAPRYLGVALVPALVVLGGALVGTRTGRIVLAGLTATFVVAALPGIVDPAGRFTYAKSNASWSIRPLAAALNPGDLVVAGQDSQLPLVAYYAAGPGRVFASPLGAVADPTMVDWTDLRQRLEAADPASALSGLLEAVPVGGHVLLVDPLRWDTGDADPYAQAVATDGQETDAAVLGDPTLTVVAARAVPPGNRPANPMAAVLLVKTA